ncbi:MAG TPA: TlyA family RNA methyltransferase [Anaerolineae bacterium]|nr:TlyA family RNA methyltransferase [Anaerolineae bacterium]HQI84008.1 TlyA family RNA methyltransferase [Anaerolineae bacterium]
MIKQRCERNIRLDLLLVERGLTESRTLAQRLIHAGEVLVNGQLADKPGATVAEDAVVTLKAKPRFVSRGGEKLAAALERFPVAVAGKIAADIGASTGGFTDCLLQYGAAKVYAIDVGYGQLAWELRQDARVIALERVNARYLAALPEPVDVIVSDVSFISLRIIYATAVRWLKPDGAVISLIKPQFEAGREHVGKGGVVRDPAVHRQVLETVTAEMAALGLGLCGLMVSPLRGPAGNVEFLGWWKLGTMSDDIQMWIDRTLGSV